MAVLALLAAGCGDDGSSAGGGGVDSGSNPDRAAPPWYTQGPLSIPTVLNDTFESVVSSWNPAVRFLWSYDDLNVFQTYSSLTLPQNELIVAVVDTGVDSDHPDLNGRLWMNPVEGTLSNYANGVDDDHDGFVDDFIGWDFANNTNNPADDNGHGTHLSGTIGAIGGNGAGIIGVAPWVRIMPIKVCDAMGSCDSVNIRAGIAYAVKHGAKIINISLGAIETGPDVIAFDQAIADATKAGALVFAAAGNDGGDVANMAPANATYAVAVSAYRNDAKLCSFSNTGWKVDLSGPGCGWDGATERAAILSLTSHKCGWGGNAPCQTGNTFGGGLYSLKAGTSMATPHAAGMAAVAWTASPTATPLQIRQALLRSARKPQAGAVDSAFGMGRLSATNLINEAQTAPGVKITSPRYGTVASSQTIGFRIEARSSPVTWKLSYSSNVSAADVNLTSGTLIASSTTAVGAGEYVDLTAGWSPPATGTYLVILEADSNGQQYFDVTVLGR